MPDCGASSLSVSTTVLRDAGALLAVVFLAAVLAFVFEAAVDLLLAFGAALVLAAAVRDVVPAAVFCDDVAGFLVAAESADFFAADAEARLLLLLAFSDFSFAADLLVSLDFFVDGPSSEAVAEATRVDFSGGLGAISARPETVVAR